MSARALRVAPEPEYGPPRPVWNEGATLRDSYLAEFELAGVMTDAALKARRIMLHAGARVDHGLCRQLDQIATEFSWHRDEGGKGLNGLAVTRSLIRLYGGDLTEMYL